MALASISSKKNKDYEEVISFRGLKARVSTFYDVIRILGRPTLSVSSDKRQIKFSRNMYFYYKKLGIKIYGNSASGFGLKTLKRTKIEQILRKK